ncbi:MAG: DUF4255 domain-containing protein [Candidatus Methanoperedens sp.]|nr:DUF4255 domain-containing protein [Candidatus Methanoperedens sp.]MCZ7361570.1 DUF4255 domain-containing protein [Candidatus Methanoperedens sp.]HLB71680.1 DUF4255 domain-containing protein [Candidatus Methanoperedens sp.]
MSDTAIADVGDALITMLRDNMGIPPATIMLISPGEIEANDNVRLSLFLYQVRENAHLRNQEMQQIDPSHLKYPPLPLELYYMLTAHPSTGIPDRTERTKEEHGILGKAMQILYDNTMLTISDYELRITLNTMSLDDMTKIWTTFQGKSFRPSACYLVTPVKIDSMREMSVKRVERKETESGSMVPEREEE